jgi:hypothetical protein
MNQHLATYPKGDKLEMKWLTQLPSPADEAALEIAGTPTPRQRDLTIGFRRTAIGLCLDPLFVTVVGERAWEFEDKEATAYVPLDEAIDTDNIADVLEQVVRFKDQYLSSSVYCANEPDSMVQALRRIDGLSAYPAPQIEAVAQDRWPTFVDFNTVAAVNIRNLPDEHTITTVLNATMDEKVTNPRTGLPLIGADAQAIPRILFLDDFPTYRTMQSLRTNAPGGTTALYLAVFGLTHSKVFKPTAEEREADRLRFDNPNRNPTGY